MAVGAGDNAAYYDCIDTCVELQLARALMPDVPHKEWPIVMGDNAHPGVWASVVLRRSSQSNRFGTGGRGWVNCGTLARAYYELAIGRLYNFRSCRFIRKHLETENEYFHKSYFYQQSGAAWLAALPQHCKRDNTGECDRTPDQEEVKNMGRTDGETHVVKGADYLKPHRLVLRNYIDA
jgi:hypothetical protein